jgi:flagellar biosynthetic protein FliO
MKTVLMKLLILMLFLPCAFGQSVSSSSPAESRNINGSLGIAADKMQPAPAADVQDGAGHFPVLRTLGGMGLVLCLMIGIYFAAKKFAPRYFTRVAAERNLKVIETLPMGDRRSISMIEVDGNRFLVGNTPQQINLLAALPEPKSSISEPDALPANPKEKGWREFTSPFRNLFEVEKKKRPQSQYMAPALPEDIRTKMRQLRESLER